MLNIDTSKLFQSGVTRPKKICMHVSVRFPQNCLPKSVFFSYMDALLSELLHGMLCHCICSITVA